MRGEERPLAIRLTNPGSIDWYYGSGTTAYNSFEEVYTTIPAAIRLGKTVAIKTGNTLIEYWFASGVTDNDLVKKGSDVDLSGYQLAGDYVSASTLSYYFNKTESDNRFQPLGSYVIPSDLSAYQLANQKNSANGYAGLNSSGLLPFSLFPDRLLGNVIYRGTYNGSIVSSADATLNGQPLPVASSANTGFYFISTSAFTYSGLNFETGDWIISNGAAGWDKVDNSDAVTSVFGRVGNIVANSSDYDSFYALKATTLAGYNITDGVTTNTTQTISGSKTFTNATTTIRGIRFDTSGSYDIGTSGFRARNIYAAQLNAGSSSSLTIIAQGGGGITFTGNGVDGGRMRGDTGNWAFGGITTPTYKVDIQSAGASGYFKAGDFTIDANGLVSADSLVLTGSGNTVSNSTSNTIQKKIKINIGGTDYYLLASTSAT